MYEYKTMKINPSNLNSVLNVRSCFGWELGSSQEINVKDSHIERDGDKIYSVTESEHYTTVTFKRDDRIPNRNKLVTLEKDYDNATASKNHYNSKYYDVKSKLSIFKIILYTVISAILLFAINMPILCIGVAVGLFILRKKLMDKYSKLYDQFSQLASSLLSEAKSLVR